MDLTFDLRIAAFVVALSSTVISLLLAADTATLGLSPQVLIILAIVNSTLVWLANQLPALRPTPPDDSPAPHG